MELSSQSGLDSFLQDGRRSPWIYSEDLAEKVLSRIVEGGLLTRICRQPGYPPLSAIYRWRKSIPDFAFAFEESLRFRREFWVEQAIQYAEEVAESEVATAILKMKAIRHTPVPAMKK